MTAAGDALSALEAEIATHHLRGQWQGDAQRNQNIIETAETGIYAEPIPAAQPHVWTWAEMRPLLDKALGAMTESKTARRTLSMVNPGLPRGTTQTLITAIQIIHPGEIAWVHRHTITALRFVIQGGEDVFTVVDGEPLRMTPYDLILTPNWTWHDHHNESDTPAIWLDALDVPLMHSLNQIFYEEPAATQQNRRQLDGDPSPLLRRAGPANGAAERPLRYPWSVARAELERRAAAPHDPCDGIALEYVNTATGGPALRTISCRVQMLPPGFSGARHRHTTSSVYFAIGGEGAIEMDDATLEWVQHDTLAMPHWTWHRHVNRSATEPAFLFSVNDTPVLEAFGLYREETEGASPSPAAPPEA